MTDYELIGEFMNDGLPKADWSFYSSDWNLLIPVVEKIHGLVPRAFNYSSETGPLSPLAELHIYDGIDVIYKAVVDFIKWYNQQPK